MMSKKFRDAVLAAAVLVSGFVVPCLMATKADAIPAFSRKYKKECVACHTIYPERNEYGEAFEKNGYLLPDADTTEKSAPKTEAPGTVITIADPLAEAGIPSQIPLSLYAQANMTYNKQNPDINNKPQFAIDGGQELELFGAGNFLNKVSYWADYNFTDKEVGELFAIFIKPFDLPLNVKVGKFKPTLSLWKSSNRATLSKPLYISDRVDSGNFKINGEQAGIEISSLVLPRLYVATGITDGLSKKTNAKDWYGHVSTKIGGSDFKAKEPDLDLDNVSLLDYLSLTLGGYGYVGSSNDSTNDFYRAGIDAALNWKKATLKVGGIIGNDSKPNLIDPSTMSRMGFVTAEYLFTQALQAALRFDIENIEHVRVTRRIVPNISYSPVQNVRLTAEYVSEYTKKAVGDKEHSDEATLNLAFAF